VKRKFYIIMAVLSGLIFGLAAFYYFNFLQNPLNTELKPLVVASADIPTRTVIKPEMVEIINVPVSGYPQGGASSLQEISGKVLLVGVKKGDYLLSPMLEGSSNTDSTVGVSSNSYSFTVPEGKRAVAIPVSLVSSVGFKVKTGDYVDILVTIDVENESGSKTVTSLIAQNVLVLNTGTTVTSDNKETASSGAYILALNVPQAMSVTLGSEKGSLRLLLRNPANKETTTQAPVDSSVYANPNYFNMYK